MKAGGSTIDPTAAGRPVHTEICRIAGHCRCQSHSRQCRHRCRRRLSYRDPRDGGGDGHGGRGRFAVIGRGKRRDRYSIARRHRERCSEHRSATTGCVRRKKGTAIRGAAAHRYPVHSRVCDVIAHGSRNRGGGAHNQRARRSLGDSDGDNGRHRRDSFCTVCRATCHSEQIDKNKHKRQKGAARAPGGVAFN
jgi:hypothetical protein